MIKKKSEILIRNIKISDTERIQVLSEQLGYVYPAAKINERIETVLKSNEKVFIAESDNMAVGYIHLQKYNVLYADPSINVLGLVVDENYRRKGIAGALIRVAEKWAVENGACCMRVASNVIREGAHVFYEKMGYECTKTQKRFIKVL